MTGERGKMTIFSHLHCTVCDRTIKLPLQAINTFHQYTCMSCLQSKISSQSQGQCHVKWVLVGDIKTYSHHSVGQLSNQKNIELSKV